MAKEASTKYVLLPVIILSAQTYNYKSKTCSIKKGKKTFSPYTLSSLKKIRLTRMKVFDNSITRSIIRNNTHQINFYNYEI